MTKVKRNYKCTECEATLAKWEGRCPACRAWNTVSEYSPASKDGHIWTSAEALPRELGSVVSLPLKRLRSTLEEYDRVVGGGHVLGSVCVIGGEPGVGKSTLAMQLADAYSSQDWSVLYVSGEETEEQVGDRARRLGMGMKFEMLSSRSARRLYDLVSSGEYEVVFVDSLQVFVDDELEISPHSHLHVRAMTERLAACAKEARTLVVLLSQINKEGALLGPKAVEHIVDIVVAMDGDRDSSSRQIRVSKNRFGRAPEYAILQMGPEGLSALADLGPSELSRLVALPGRIFFPALAGTKIRIAEVQALVMKEGGDLSGRTICEGFDARRLSMILAILQSTAGVDLRGYQVALQVTGGWSLSDAGADLPVALAVLSAVSRKALGWKTTAFGELSLLGEIRGVREHRTRLEVAQRMGMDVVVAPSMPPEPKTDLVLSTLLESLGLKASCYRAVG